MKNCLICGSGRSAPYKEGLYGQEVAQCRDCGLVFTAAAPDEKALSGRYGEEYYSGWLLPEQRERRRRLWERRTRLLLRLGGRGRLLDGGCGEGLFLDTARRMGYDVHGVEFSGYAAGHAGREFGLSVQNCRFEDCDYPEGWFDIVTFWHVLEHLPSPAAALEKARRLLKPGGLLVAAVPNIDDRLGQELYRLVRGEYFKVYTPAAKEPHLYHFSPVTFRRLLENGGFGVEKIRADLSQVDPYMRLVEYASWFLSLFLRRKIYLAILAVARK